MPALAAIAACAALMAAPIRPTWLDQLDLASRRSREAHSVAWVLGSVRRDHAVAGTLRLPVEGIALRPGGSLSCRLTSDDRQGSAQRTLFITLHTAPVDHGKTQRLTVRLNGRPLCILAETDPGAGQARTLALPAPVSAGALHVEIQSGAASACPITVAALRLVAGVASRKERAGIALLTSQGSGYTIDTAEMRRLLHMLPVSPSLVGQTAVLYNFAIRSASQNVAEISRLVKLAEETRIPLRVAFQMHWAGLPQGVPDGAGGTFTDLPYQQVTFDPDNTLPNKDLDALMGDRADPRFGLSIPNRWSNTAWLSMNHPRLNQFRRVRLLQAVRALLSERERLAERGLARLIPGQLSTGEEAIYWAKGVDDSAYTAANGGKPRSNLMADFGPFVAADAQRDGVDLDPRNGLDSRERWWLHQNLARWQQRIVDWMLEAAPAEPITCGADGQVFAGDLLRRNIFTEPYGMPAYPMKDLSPLRPLLEVGYVRDGRSGGEYWSGATMLPWLIKERERGRIALPNLECTGADDAQLLACLQATYACGARFITLYNWQHRTTTAQVLRRFAGAIAEAAGLVWMPAPPGAGIAPAPAGVPAGRDYAAAPEAFGVNRIEVWRVDPGVQPQPARVRISETVGPNPRFVDMLTMLPPTTSLRPGVVILPTLFAQTPGQTYRLTVTPTGASQVALARAADGMLAARLLADVQFERSRSLIISDRQDAVDIIASLSAKHARSPQGPYATDALAGARRLLETGDARAAYAAAVRAEQVSLPAAFLVAPPGSRLSPYYISVRPARASVKATLTSFSTSLAVVSLVSREAQQVCVTWGDLETKASLSPGVAAQVTLDRGRLRP